MGDYDRFTKLCRTTLQEVPTYRTHAECNEALDRCRDLWERTGAYGSWKGWLDEVVAVCQDRWLALEGLARSVPVRVTWVTLAEEADACGLHEEAAECYRKARDEQRWAYSV